jgi:ethanolamine utilization protein EutQ
MAETQEGIRLFTPEDVQTWIQSEQRQIFLGDVVDATNSDTMGVGFARYAPGESNEWVVTYDEVLIVTRGAFSVTSTNGHKTTAKAGEFIFLRKDTKLVYSAGDSGAELVYVMYPHWTNTQLASDHADLVDTFHPVDRVPPRFGDAPTNDNVALMQSIWGPLERGESHDLGPFFDALADDVVFKTAVGEVRGKQALIGYLATASVAMEFNIFEKPFEYYGDGDRVVILGDESFKVKDTGATHRAEWAWVVDVHDGLITRILHHQDLAGVAGPVREALKKAQSNAVEQPTVGSA